MIPPIATQISNDVFGGLTISEPNVTVCDGDDDGDDDDGAMNGACVGVKGDLDGVPGVWGDIEGLTVVGLHVGAVVGCLIMFVLCGYFFII